MTDASPKICCEFTPRRPNLINNVPNKLTDLLDSKKFKNFELKRRYFIDGKQSKENFDTPDLHRFS